MKMMIIIYFPHPPLETSTTYPNAASNVTTKVPTYV